MILDAETYISHYGKKGMKWGVRNKIKETVNRNQNYKSPNEPIRLVPKDKELGRELGRRQKALETKLKSDVKALKPTETVKYNAIVKKYGKERDVITQKMFDNRTKPQIGSNKQQAARKKKIAVAVGVGAAFAIALLAVKGRLKVPPPDYLKDIDALARDSRGIIMDPQPHRINPQAVKRMADSMNETQKNIKKMKRLLED